MQYRNWVLLLSLLGGPVYAGITGYPWSSGVSITSSEADGQKISLSLQQGVEWKLHNNWGWTISPFIGIEYDRSSVILHSWNNSTKPKYGIELANQFSYGPINWAEIRVGIQKQNYYYHDKITEYRQTERKETYLRMYMSGNWSH